MTCPAFIRMMFHQFGMIPLGKLNPCFTYGMQSMGALEIGAQITAMTGTAFRDSAGMSL